MNCSLLLERAIIVFENYMIIVKKGGIECYAGEAKDKSKGDKA